MTKSERLFESFCHMHDITCRRIPEATKQRPDYELEIECQLLLAEIKQFDPNEEEKKVIARREEGKQGVLGGKPGGRLRNVIHSANSQLREQLNGRSIPTLLVAYNNTPCSLHTEPYAVMTAMQGFDAVDVELSPNPTDEPQFGPLRKAGRGQAMRDDTHTLTSVIAILRDPDETELLLDVYHNRHAVTPLEARLLCFPGVVHYRLPENELSSSQSQWEEFS